MLILSHQVEKIVLGEYIGKNSPQVFSSYSYFRRAKEVFFLFYTFSLNIFFICWNNTKLSLETTTKCWWGGDVLKFMHDGCDKVGNPGNCFTFVFSSWKESNGHSVVKGVRLKKRFFSYLEMYKNSSVLNAVVRVLYKKLEFNKF